MEIQQKQVLLLQMIKKVDELFRQNNIPYTLLGGSVLGAIRHKGFIPWDDDIDIGIFRNDFEKAEKLLLTLKQLIYEPIDGNTLPTVHIGKLRFPEDNKKGDNLSSIDWTDIIKVQYLRCRK